MGDTDDLKESNEDEEILVSGDESGKKSSDNLRRCTKCKRLTSGHEGPYGSKCSLIALSPEELKEDDIKKLQSKSNKPPDKKNEDDIEKQRKEAEDEAEKLKKAKEEMEKIDRKIKDAKEERRKTEKETKKRQDELDKERKKNDELKGKGRNHNSSRRHESPYYCNDGRGREYYRDQRNYRSPQRYNNHRRRSPYHHPSSTPKGRNNSRRIEHSRNSRSRWLFPIARL